MSVKDVIKKSVLESGAFGQYDIPAVFAALIAALLLGILIFLVYKKFYAGVIYSRTFAVTLVGMTVLTCMVTLAISTNVVITWYGRCLVDRAFPYCGQGSDGPSVPFLGDHNGDHCRGGDVCSGTSGSGSDDPDDRIVLS